MSNTSTEMSFAPETWSIRPASSSERDLATGAMTSTGPLDEEDGCSELEELSGTELELLATEELLSGAVTASAISYFCPLMLSVSLNEPVCMYPGTEPATVTKSPVLSKVRKYMYQLSRLYVCTLLNVMVSNVPPAATVWFKLPVTTTWFASLEDDSSLLDDTSTLDDEGVSLEEDSTELELSSLLDTGSSLELLCSLEDDSSLLDDTSTLDDDGVSLEELGGTSLEEDSTALLLDSLAELELGGGVTMLEDEGSELELLASEEELLSTLDDDGVSLEDDSSLLELSSLLEDATELEDLSTTVIFPSAEALPSAPVTAIQ